MYYVDMPTAEDIGALNRVRSEACVSITVLSMKLPVALYAPAPK